VRVLIVDDEPVFREAARALLEARGHVVVGEAHAGRAALAAAARVAPDAVLLDVSLGAESGFDVARALTHRWPKLAVLLVSVTDAGVSPTRVRACGARGFLLKERLVAADFATLWGHPVGTTPRGAEPATMTG
jgi:DNA-binding NarL/FixJ family response regulator